MADEAGPSSPGGWDNGLPPVSPVRLPRGAPGALRVGQRVRKLGTAAQLGVCRYLGPLDGRPGVWVGVEWDELGTGDGTGELGGRRYFRCSPRGQKAGNAASFVRESELFTGDLARRAEHTPLVVRPGEDVYDWAVRPRDSFSFDFLMLMRSFSCCGARCILPDDEDELAAAVSRGDLRRLARDASLRFGEAGETELGEVRRGPMRAPDGAPGFEKGA